MKKYISSVLISCMLIQLYGCYSMQEISKEEMIQQVDKSDIKIWTKENIYTFEDSAYTLQNDSIIGHGKIEMTEGNNSDTISTLDAKIALSEVLKIEAYKYNLAHTLIVVGVQSAILIIFLVVKEALGDGLGMQGSVIGRL